LNYAILFCFCLFVTFLQKMFVFGVNITIYNSVNVLDAVIDLQKIEVIPPYMVHPSSKDGYNRIFRRIFQKWIQTLLLIKYVALHGSSLSISDVCVILIWSISASIKCSNTLHTLLCWRNTFTGIGVLLAAGS
jgi:hypothetical protein